MVSDKVKFLYFLLLILSIFTVSCGNSKVDEVFMDKSFLEKEPCVAPCWYGLELEKSTEEDVYEVLTQLPFVIQDSIVKKGMGWWDDDSATLISYTCMYPKNTICGSIGVSRDKVVEIYMDVNYDLPLSLIVDELGEPDYVMYDSPSHYIGCHISLSWPKKLISVSIDSEEKCPDPNTTKFSPDSKATFLVYTTDDRFSLVGEENKHPWPGFSEP